MARTLKDMVVVITGASAGIGRELAVQLSAAGARLVLSARRLERLEELNAAIGGQHLCIRADVAVTDDCNMLIDRAAAHFGRIDTLICNAGYGMYRTVGQTSPADMREIFATNVFGTSDCIHAALPLMLKQDLRDGYRAQVMLISSAAARRSPPYMGAYSATKAAQLSLAEAMRVELRPQKIAVTSVHPMVTRTEFGSVAETLGDVSLPKVGPVQAVEPVVRQMVRAIERPARELWPSRPSRFLLSLATIAPGLSDRVLTRFRERIEQKGQAPTGDVPLRGDR